MLNEEVFNCMKKSHPLPSHLLHLKQHLGLLERRHLDLPPVKKAHEVRYLRRRERSMIPTSYRTGFVFFGFTMILSLFVVATFDAQTMAESHRGYLQAQLLEEFNTFSSSLEAYQHRSQDEAELLLPQSDTSLADYYDPLELQALLVQMGLEVRQGSAHFQDLISSWGKDLPVLERLNWMESSAQKSLRVWDRLFTSLESFPFHRLDLTAKNQLQRSLVTMAEVRDFLTTFLQLADPLRSVLGSQAPQRILVFIQDPHERRATGGALSAGVELLVESGEILHWKPFHVDELDGLQGALPVPAELAGVSTQPSVATANHFLDVPKSAEQISWFWQRQARSSPDLIVIVSTEVFERLFSVMPEPAFENLSLRWSALRLSEDREALKELSSTLVKAFGKIVSQPELFFRSATLLSELRDEKHFSLWSPQAPLQQTLTSFRLHGALPSPLPHEDFLMISGVNMGENASDRWIVENAELHTAISEEGRVKNWLKIEQRHRWEPGFLEPLMEKVGRPLSRPVIQQLSSAPHERFVRLVVPKGSLLQSAIGVDLLEVSMTTTDEFAVWSFRQKLIPGEIKSVELVYELPWAFDTQTVDNYRLTLVKQAGTPAMGFRHLIKLPSSLSVFQSLPEESILELRKDERVAVVAGRNP